VIIGRLSSGFISSWSANICVCNLFRTLHQEIQCYETQYYYTPQQRRDCHLEYLVGRSSGRYRASHPFWYRRRRKEKPIHTFAPGATVAGSTGEAFRPAGLQREEQRQYQYHEQSGTRAISAGAATAISVAINTSVTSGCLTVSN
jgi:hypothetical protein